MNSEHTLRLWRDTDSLSELTELLHRAYKPLADIGLRFMATHQVESVTLDRIQSGICYVVESETKLIATATLYAAALTSGANWYRQLNVAHIGQFAVEPLLQNQGIGSWLMNSIEAEAFRQGFTELAQDTAESADHLISYYERRGYRFVEYCQWNEVNYRSVIMSKLLNDASTLARQNLSNRIEL